MKLSRPRLPRSGEIEPESKRRWFCEAARRVFEAKMTVKRNAAKNGRITKNLQDFTNRLADASATISAEPRLSRNV